VWVVSAKGEPHPLMRSYGIDAVPFQHEKMEEWRDALRRGVAYDFPGTNLKITGAIDDVWVNPQGELMVVDYKATSKKGEVTLDAEWQISYKRQMEIYQWLFRRNDFKVARTGYFVYCNGITDKEAFDAKLEFDVTVIPYEGDDSWVESAILNAYKCLQSSDIPAPAQDCNFCTYRQAVSDVEA